MKQTKGEKDGFSFPGQVNVRPWPQNAYYIALTKSALYYVGFLFSYLWTEWKNCSINCHFLTHCMCLTDCVYLQCSGWKSLARLADVLCFNAVLYGRIRTLLTVASHCVTPQATTFYLKGCQGAYLKVLTVSFVGQACALSPFNTKEQWEIKTFICSTELCSAPLLFSFLFFFLNVTMSALTAVEPHCRISRVHLFGFQTLAQGQKRWTHHLTFCVVDVSISLACFGLTVL